jgi:hypothetical protein
VGETCDRTGKCTGRKARRKDTLVRLRCRWEDGIRMGLRETGWERVEWF